MGLVLIENKLPLPSKIHTIVFDFDGVFTDNKVYIHENGNEAVMCDRSDGYAFDLLRAYFKKNNLDINMFILSKEPNSVVLSRAKKLKLNCFNSVNNKLSFMDKYFKEFIPDNINPYNGLIYLGNDLNDLIIMEKATYSIAPSDAHPLVIKTAYCTLPQKGGFGFIRAFVEIFLQISNFTKDDLYELISNC
jgi:3-deoxy-D-manno-octulosonate 8-phosphate phosphatase (KDO 8-P phosphatase)